jgi:hypothetical protein
VRPATEACNRPGWTMDTILQMLSHSVEQLLGRASGPLHFRLLIMPTMVTILAIRAHLKDVREGNPIFLWAFFKSASERRRLLRSGLKDFGKVFVVACVLDSVYQLIALRQFHPVQMLFVAVACAVVPYFLVRGPITRIAVMLQRKLSGAAAEPATNAPQPSENHPEN